MDRTGNGAAESILNEWNYVRGWVEDWNYTLTAEGGLKGASFATGVLCVTAESPVDMLMYYDARPGGMNGFFDPVIVGNLRKTYFPYLDFAAMRRAGPRVETAADDPDLFALAVAGEKESHILFTYYNENDESPAKEVELQFSVEGKKRSAASLPITGITRRCKKRFPPKARSRCACRFLYSISGILRSFEKAWKRLLCSRFILP